MNLHITVQVPRSPDINQIVDRFQHKLEPLLFVFQPELVQLQGRLVRHTSREGVCCRLNLHLPTGQLSSESTAPTAQSALRSAGADLLRQLQRHKQRLRESRPRFRPLPARSAPMPPVAVEAPERRADLAAYFGGHYQHLLAFVRRQIALREHLGELKRGWMEPAEVLDEVILSALQARPSDLDQNRGRWLLLLCAAAIRNLEKSYGEQRHGQQLRSFEEPETGASVEDQEGERLPRLEDRLASDHADPEEDAAAAEAMERLAAALRPLPHQQRHDLVLYLLEGFRPQELAQLSRRSEAEVRASLEQAEAALRHMPDVPSLLRRPLPLELKPAARQARRPPSLRPPRAEIVPQRT